MSKVTAKVKGGKYKVNRQANEKGMLKIPYIARTYSTVYFYLNLISVSVGLLVGKQKKQEGKR